MLLKLAVVVAAIAQVVGAAFLSIGTFEQTTREIPVLVQPAGWAFSIWGLIYALSFVYAIYQLIPKYDNQIVRATRVPALVGFVGSIVWLFFAGQSSWLVWLTIPVLFLMAIVLTFVVRAPETGSAQQIVLSKRILLPYAAWTAIASWVNIAAVVLDEGVVTSAVVNMWINLVLFVGIATFTLYYFRRSGYSAWYGGVMVWASGAIAVANVSGGSVVFVVLGAAFALLTIAVYIRKVRR